MLGIEMICEKELAVGTCLILIKRSMGQQCTHKIQEGTVLIYFIQLPALVFGGVWRTWDTISTRPLLVFLLLVVC